MPEPVRANWQASDTMKGQIAVPGQPAPVAQAFWGGVAEYMVAMQPTVGVALADWLDQDAEKHLPDSECRYCDPVTNPSGVPCPGLAVARALGGTK